MSIFKLLFILAFSKLDISFSSILSPIPNSSFSSLIGFLGLTNVYDIFTFSFNIIPELPNSILYLYIPSSILFP